MKHAIITLRETVETGFCDERIWPLSDLDPKNMHTNFACGMYLQIQIVWEKTMPTTTQVGGMKM